MERIAAPLILLLVACGPGGNGPDTTAAKDTGMPAMSGMAGMGGMQSGAMMDSMAIQVRALDTASTATLQAMLPTHRQAVANMIAQMNTEMRTMNMTADARWTAIMDSVRQDLVRMPEMNPQQLQANVPAHHNRLTRLMQSHREMMKRM